MNLDKDVIQRVRRGKYKDRPLTNAERYRAWLVKMAADAVNYGNARFQFSPKN